MMRLPSFTPGSEALRRGAHWLAAAGMLLHAGAAPWTFEAALECARTNSPDARIAEQRMVEADAALLQANATWWPQVRIDSSYGYTDNPMRAFGAILNQRQFDPTIDFNRVPGVDHLNVRGLVTVPIYAGGASAAGREAARAGARATRHDAEAIRQTLAYAVARAFHTVQKAGALVRAAEAGVNAFEGHVAVARQREAAGTLLRADVLDLEVRLAQAREDLVRTVNGRSLAVRALRNLLGIEDEAFAVSEEVPEVLPPPDEEGDRRRPELSAAAEREATAEARVRGAKAGYRPRLSAFGAVDYDHGWRLNGGEESYTAGAVVQWDIWDGQLTRGRTREARAGLETAREESRKLHLALDLEREQARLALDEANGRLEVTAKAVEQAAESVELTRARFGQGLALPTQLIDAETALTSARVRRAEAEADRRVAIAALRRALFLPQVPTQEVSR